MMQNLPTILDHVAVWFNLRTSDLRGPSRLQHITIARQVFMWVAREHTGASYREIGRIIGNRDHTTVLHGVRATQRRMTQPDRRWGDSLLLDVRRIEAGLKRRETTGADVAYV